MRRPLIGGMQLAAFLLLPLAGMAQPSDEPTPPSPLEINIDTARADTAVADDAPLLTQTSTDSTEETLELESVESRAPFTLGMVAPEDAADSAAVVLEFREEPEVVTYFIDSALAASHLASADEHLAAQDFDLAQGELESALLADPFNVRAFTGLGYIYAWSGRHDDAAEQFRRALAVDNTSHDAAKGLAYVAHWKGLDDEAAARFGALAAQRPEDVELAMMHAQSLLAARRSSEARTAFERVLALDPDNADARAGLDIARSARPKVELTTWAGATWFDDNERPRAESNVGIRYVEVAIWPTRSARLWFQYDNGLTLDNVILSEGNRTVPAGYIGGFLHYERIHTTRVELGWRSLPGTVGQVLLRSEHVVTLPNNFAVKGGLWLGLRSDDRTEWIGHAGLGIPIGDRFEVTPTFFFSRNGMPNEREWRILLSGEYRFPNGVQLAGGWAGGQASTGYIDDFRGMSDRFLKVSFPVGLRNRAHALLRTEFVGETDATTILAVGITFGLSER
jgi:tetratricopeptide (TPR) repeat protein